MSRPRAVVDTNVWVSAFWNPDGAPALVIDAWRKDRFVLCYSHAVRDEYRTTLTRFFGKGGTMPPHIAADFAATKSKGAAFRDLPDLRDSIPEDPRDEKFLECAVAAQAVIVSGDKHLLKRDGFYGIAVIEPADFIRNLKL